MHFVGGNRRFKRRRSGALEHPGFIFPGKVLEVGDYGGGEWPQLRAEAVGIRFVDLIGAKNGFHMIFISCPYRDPRDEEFPDSALSAPSHRMDAAVPGVKVADYRDPARVRGPYREMHSGYRAYGTPMCA